MLQDLIKHKSDYSVLAVMAGAFVLYFLQNISSPTRLVYSTAAFAILYLAWGIWHHRRLGILTRHVVLEYFLVGLLGFVIVSSLLL